jgi:zinc transport system substrate-binding protein
MRRFIFGEFLLMLIVVGCVNRSAPAGHKVVTVSILPEKYFVERIAGDEYRVNVLIPPGANPHSYEPSPSQLLDMSASLVYFRIGHLGFETGWTEKLRSVYPEMHVVDLDAGMDLADEAGADTRMMTKSADPHIWMNPPMVREACKVIRDELTRMDPVRKETYERNYQEFSHQIDSLDTAFRTFFSVTPKKTFLVYHPVLTYFAREYGLRQVSFEVEGKEPSAATLVNLTNLARKEGIRHILVQKEFSLEKAKTIAREIDGSVIQIDPLAEDWLVNMKKIGGDLQMVLKQ